MHKAIRVQSDDLFDEYSQLASAELEERFEGAEDLTRQEAKDSTDINVMMAKFNVFQPQRQLQFGDVDYGLDLQSALNGIEQVKEAYAFMPAEIRREFRTWQSFLSALESGLIVIKPESEQPIVTESLQSKPSGAQ